MKRLICTLILAIFGSLPSWGQATAISWQAINQFGQPLPGAKIRVCSVTSTGTPCSPTTPIFLDYAMTIPAANPYTADQYGNFTVYGPPLAAPDLYVVQITPASGVTWSYVFNGAGNQTAGVTQIIAGNNITISPTSGLGAVTINATVSSSCGAVAGDNTSTNCGFNNRVPDSATIPANISTFGSSLLDNNLYGNNVAVGVNSGNTHGVIFPGAAWSNAVLIGNALANGHDAAGTDLIDIGMTNGAFIDPFSATYQSDAYDASTITLGFGNIIGTDPQTNACNPTSMIVMGHANLNQCTGNSLLASIVMGESNLFEPVPLTNTQQLNRSVVLGNYNLYQLPATATVNDSFLVGTHVADYYQTLANVFAFGYKAFQQQTASTWSLQNAIAIGEFAGQGVPNNSSELVLLGDGAGNITPNQATPLTDAIMIGDLTGEGNVGHDKVAIGHNAMGTIGFGFNSGNELIAIGDAALLCGTTGTENIAIGHLAGSIGAVPGSFTCANSNHTGSNNVWIGTRAGPNTTSQLSNTVALGYQAFNTASNQTVIGNSSMTQLIAYGTGDGCLSSLSGVITGSGLACGSGGGSGVQYNPANTQIVFTGSSWNGDDARIYGTAYTVSSWSCNGTICTFDTSTPHGGTTGDYFSVQDVSGWFTATSPFANWTSGVDLFQITVTSATQFTIPYTAHSGASGSGGTVESANYFLPFAVAHKPFYNGHGVVTVKTAVGSTMAGLDANFAAVIGNATTSPAFLALSGAWDDDLANCASAATIEGHLQSVFAQAHTAGFTVMVDFVAPLQFNTSNLACPTAFQTWLAVDKWIRGQGKTNANAASGQYWDIPVGAGDVVRDAGNADIIYTGNFGVLSPGGIQQQANVWNEAMATQSSSIKSFPFYWIPTPFASGGIYSNTYGMGFVPTLDSRQAFAFFKADLSKLYFNIDSSSDKVQFPQQVNGCAQLDSAGTMTSTGLNCGSPTGGINTYTSDQTASSADFGHLVIMNCSAACVYHLPSTAPITNWYASVMTVGSTNATIVVDGGLGISSITYNGGATMPVLNKFKPMLVYFNFRTVSAIDYEGDAPLIQGANMNFTPASNGFTLATSVRQWSCQPGLGDGLNAITAGTYLSSTCMNTTGSTITLTGLKCFTDNSGTSTMNAAGNTLGALLTGAVTCSTSFAAGTQSANVLLTNGDYINFTFVADGTSKQTTWVVQGTY